MLKLQGGIIHPKIEEPPAFGTEGNFPFECNSISKVIPGIGEVAIY